MSWRAWLVSCLLTVPSTAFAQGHRAHDPFVAARIGTNLVGNTYRVRRSKPVAGAGFSAGVFLSPYWAAEFEMWARAFNPDGGSGRERLYSLSAERLYARAGVQPYLAGGLTVLHSEAAVSTLKSSTHLQVQVTAGVRVPIVSRLAVDVDLRGNGGGSTMIVRPTTAVVYFF